MSLVVDTHREYLADGVRVGAFRQAILETIRPGDVVVDLGSGTGILGLLACRAGARRVYAIEETGLIELARSIARANGVEERIVFVQRHSAEVVLPERADVIVCDFIGAFGYDAALVEDGADARDRFLAPGGRMIPSCVDVALAPVEDAAVYDRLDFWCRRLTGLDLAPARTWAANTGYPVAIAPESLLATPSRCSRIDMLTVTTAPQSMDAQFIASRGGTLHGIGGWFTAALSPGVSLSNGPDAATRMNRRNAFLPVERPVSIDEGDRIVVRVQVIPSETVVAWTVDVCGGDGRHKARSRQSTLRGMLMSRDDLQRTDPASVPTLTARGEARRTVLTLCDGRRSLAGIEREVFQRHPDLFRTAAEAEAFVAEVIVRYAE